MEKQKEVLKLKKLKLYLDTSVISHLFADDAPDKMADTEKLWKDCVAMKYELYISPVVAVELGRCDEPKRSQMAEKIKQARLQTLQESDEVNELADEYIKGGVLKEKSFDDCLHIAYAVVHNCDVIVSWNFKHLVNYKTINKVKVVNAINRYREIGIVSPTMIIEDDE